MHHHVGLKPDQLGSLLSDFIFTSIINHLYSISTPTRIQNCGRPPVGSPSELLAAWNPPRPAPKDTRKRSRRSADLTATASSLFSTSEFSPELQEHSDFPGQNLFDRSEFYQYMLDWSEDKFSQAIQQSAASPQSMATTPLFSLRPLRPTSPPGPPVLPTLLPLSSKKPRRE